MTDDGFDRLGRRIDRAAGDFAESPGKTFGKWAAIIGVGILALVIFVGLLGLVAGWFNAGKDIVSPTNVKKQYATVIGDYKAMEQAACNAQDAENVKHGPNDQTFLEDPAFAYKAKYRDIAQEYNRIQNNLFEAKLVGPKGYPRDAPSLQEMQTRVC